MLAASICDINFHFQATNFAVAFWLSESLVFIAKADILHTKWGISATISD